MAYADIDDLTDIQGTANLIILSNQENDSASMNTARVQRALDKADADLDEWLRKRGFSYPLSESSASFNEFNQVASRMAIVYLYEWRGVKDEQGQERVKELKAFIASTLNELAIPGRIDATMTKIQPTGPVGVVV